jgi:hypothetical protein
MRREVASVLVCLGSARAVQAQGGPPLETDDPGTPGPGRVELNVSAEAEREASGTFYDAPRLDANLGVGIRVQLKLEVPWRVATAPAESTKTGVGNVVLGIKWRFADGGSVAASTYPQLALGRSESASEKGIAESDTELLLPIEIAWDAGPAALNMEVGYQHAARPSLELLVECHGSGAMDLTRQGVLCGLGFRWKLQQAASLMGAFAAGIAGSAEDRPDHRMYGGVQLRW